MLYDTRTVRNLLAGCRRNLLICYLSLKYVVLLLCIETHRFIFKSHCVVYSICSITTLSHIH
jgi:hypothetical protein